MDNLVTILLASISGILLIYNFVLGRKLNKSRNEEVKEIEKDIKESKNETTKLTNELNDLIGEYHKLRKTDSNKSN